MKAFDPNHKLLDEMYQDDYYPAFLVDKVKGELQKVIDLLESGETDTEVRQPVFQRFLTDDGAVPGMRPCSLWLPKLRPSFSGWPVCELLLGRLGERIYQVTEKELKI